ncbi:MAG: hypothetical protein FWE02_00955 [Defluviitaleaceae bacterium]|nr:hypothetical protein [Defluviitaleaceae bacterium]
MNNTRKIRMPWWFLFAALIGMLSFVPLLIAGFRLKNWLWISLGIVQFIGLFFGPLDGIIFDIFMWSSIGLGIYVFTYVRKKYLTEMEIRDAMRQTQRQPQQTIPTASPTPVAQMKAWTCIGCGAENNNVEGICEYCGVAMKTSKK